MQILKCKMCGGELAITEEVSVCECEYCGSKQTVPTVDDEKIIKLYERANRFRRANEFDKASVVYESIIEESDAEAEAYWGLILCRYGIEYVDDPSSGDKLPTCHRLSFDSVMEDEDLEHVMENADTLSRTVYREQAKQIEEIRKGILEVSGNEEPYDIFICYKETADDGDRTIDSVIAQDVYDTLTDKGYRVFFSRISLEDKLGTEYEPYIFAALNSAKVMLAFGTNYDYYNAVWVKNEWSRYLKLMAKDKEKHLIPCYKDIDAYDMPKEFKHLQAQDMGKVGAIQDLVRGIDKIFGRTEKTVTEKVVVQHNGGNNVDALLMRGNIALEDGEWEKADGFFEEVLNQDAKCAEAYLGEFLVDYECSNIASLAECYVSDSEDCEIEMLEACPEDKEHIESAVSKYMVLDYLSEDEIRQQYTFRRIYPSQLSYRKQQKNEKMSELSSDKLLVRAKQYATGDTKALIDKVIEDISCEFDKRITDAEQKDKASIVSVKQSYEAHLNMADAKVQELCNSALERREVVYSSRVSQMDAAKTISDYENIRNALNGMHGYKDTLELAEKCQGEIDRLKKEERKESERREVERRKEAERKAKKKKKMAIAVSIAIVMCIALIMVVTKVIIPNVNYNKAVKLLNSGKYEEAIVAFETLDGYKDSNNQISVCNEGIKERDYNAAIELMNSGKYEEAIVVFEALDGYKNSDELYEIASLKNASVGDVVTFGNYNGNTEWEVLAKEDGKILVISKYALEKRPYNMEYDNVTWESCTLRTWLNETYITSAFSTDEQKLILSTNLENSDNNWYGTDGGNNTTDKVFLLSIDEVKNYFKSWRERRVTLYAGTLYDGTPVGWWMRSLGRSNSYATYVDGSDGKTHIGGYCVNLSHGVRPAMWIDISDL